MTLLGIDNLPGSQPLETLDLPRDVCLLFGQEGPGLSDAAREACDGTFSIAQFGSTRSINASAAAAIAMHTWVRQHADLGRVLARLNRAAAQEMPSSVTTSDRAATAAATAADQQHGRPGKVAGPATRRPVGSASARRASQQRDRVERGAWPGTPTASTEPIRPAGKLPPSSACTSPVQGPWPVR